MVLTIATFGAETANPGGKATAADGKLRTVIPVGVVKGGRVGRRLQGAVTDSLNDMTIPGTAI